jgi:tRNA G18 (ribose-2'-O)-methylase SpoU
MEEIVGYKLHSGIMAIARQPEPASLSELNSPIIILNGIVNSENVGSIVRNSAAFGINSIIVDKYTSPPFLRRAARVSMGTLIDINFHSSLDLIQTIKELKENYFYKIVSAEINNNSIEINKFIFPEKFALIFGNEGHGISQELLEVSDYIVKISISENVPSLNVATTSGVFLYLIKNFGIS